MWNSSAVAYGACLACCQTSQSSEFTTLQEKSYGNHSTVFEVYVQDNSLTKDVWPLMLYKGTF